MAWHDGYLTQLFSSHLILICRKNDWERQISNVVCLIIKRKEVIKHFKFTSKTLNSLILCINIFYNIFNTDLLVFEEMKCKWKIQRSMTFSHTSSSTKTQVQWSSGRMSDIKDRHPSSLRLDSNTDSVTSNKTYLNIVEIFNKLNEWMKDFI